MRLKRLLRQVERNLQRVMDLLLGPILAPVVSYMARTGVGTNASMKRNCLPMPVHYYSPVPDVKDLESRNIWQRRSKLGGIDLYPGEQRKLLQLLGQRYGLECDWQYQKPEDPFMYHTSTTNFSYGCAAITHSLIRHFKPKRVIEIGSGNSSKVIAHALKLNFAEDKASSFDYTVIDPFPRSPVSDGLPGLNNLIRERVELVEPDLFENLAANDILFIDSGHTIRTGGDVNYLILDVLPRLSEGVLIHFHDIPLPADYPKTYFTNPSFRVFWTEAYLLQAFMSFNDTFKVLLAMAYLMSDHLDAFADAYPNYNPKIHILSSSSFWIQRVKG